MDKLQKRAAAFQRLLYREYKLILGRKNMTIEITIDFDPADFYHLIGLHKLNDILSGGVAAKKLFSRCLRGDITYDALAKSNHFHKLGNRFEYFDRLEAMLDSNKTVFKLNTNQLRKFSRITADLEMKNILDVHSFYIFIEKRSYSDNHYLKSFIQDDNVDYTYGQTSLTLLYKEKINKKTGSSVILYNKLV